MDRCFEDWKGHLGPSVRFDSPTGCSSGSGIRNLADQTPQDIRERSEAPSSSRFDPCDVAGFRFWEASAIRTPLALGACDFEEEICTATAGTWHCAELGEVDLLPELTAQGEPRTGFSAQKTQNTFAEWGVGSLHESWRCICKKLPMWLTTNTCLLRQEAEWRSSANSFQESWRKPSLCEKVLFQRDVGHSCGNAGILDGWPCNRHLPFWQQSHGRPSSKCEKRDRSVKSCRPKTECAWDFTCSRLPSLDTFSRP